MAIKYSVAFYGVEGSNLEFLKISSFILLNNYEEELHSSRQNLAENKKYKIRSKFFFMQKPFFFYNLLNKR